MVPPRRHAKIWQHKNCLGAPWQRDEKLRAIRQKGRRRRKQESSSRFAAKSFIPAEAKEEYYLRQFQGFDTVEKMKKRDLDFVIRWTVLEPAIERGRARDLRDAIQMWKSSLLDDLIDVDRAKDVIRQRGMIPAFSLEYYFVSSRTGTQRDAEAVYFSKTFDDTVARYCHSSATPSRTTACSRRPPASAALRPPGAAEARRWAACLSHTPGAFAIS